MIEALNSILWQWTIHVVDSLYNHAMSSTAKLYTHVCSFPELGSWPGSASPVTSTSLSKKWDNRNTYLLGLWGKKSKSYLQLSFSKKTFLSTIDISAITWPKIAPKIKSPKGETRVWGSSNLLEGRWRGTSLHSGTCPHIWEGPRPLHCWLPSWW